MFWGGSAWDAALCTGSLLTVGMTPLCHSGPAGKPLSAHGLPGYGAGADPGTRIMQAGDRLDDLYFTSDFLLVYQLQVRSKQGFACIPYPEIGGVRIVQNGRAKNQLDIFSPEGTVLHTVVCSLEPSQSLAERDRTEDFVSEIQNAGGQKYRGGASPEGPSRQAGAEKRP